MKKGVINKRGIYKDSAFYDHQMCQIKQKLSQFICVQGKEIFSRNAMFFLLLDYSETDLQYRCSEGHPKML